MVVIFLNNFLDLYTFQNCSKSKSFMVEVFRFLKQSEIRLKQAEIEVSIINFFLQFFKLSESLALILHVAVE